ncbi:MAG: 2,3,4,5-tetrahydropyridine-2,6-dicarboxylate N-succinyltransferase [Bacteroidetes bacterium]|nr:2,3,4,5-tetrahydropyridine-2,6-dicarboxylate N-succinyltransferase [Bacteroidota bacterium]MCY4223599.1 2,3,4,5-tetrahydropyridine-2,6-dicarboxylate N-succinyltransferase [Bacteroidota bacterium]
MALSPSEIRQSLESSDPELQRIGFDQLILALNQGMVRAASRNSDGTWKAHAWVKKGLLYGFRKGQLAQIEAEPSPFFDKDTYPLKPLGLSDQVRLVPGGSSIRTGCYVSRDVICMPPMYINTGAYVDQGTMVDSHALVGSCAQIGKRVHLSAATQIGGVLEPPGALPVIVEDDCFIGGGCGLYEGCVIREGAVLAPGVILTRSLPMYDLVRERIIPAGEVPPLAVVVPGSRQKSGSFANRNGISLYAPVIVKYRDANTDAATELESALRSSIGSESFQVQ